MIKELVDWLIEALGAWGWVAVFIFMILESACFPIPSEIVMPFAGYMVYKYNMGIHGLLLASMIGTAANLIGSLLAYVVGFKVGKPFVEKYGKYLLIGEKEYARIEGFFKEYGGASVLIGRMLPAVRTVISLPAGIFKMNIRKFTLYTVIGSIPWNLMLTYAGYILGEKWTQLSKQFEYIDIIAVIVLIIAAIAYLHYVHSSSR